MTRPHGVVERHAAKCPFLLEALREGKRTAGGVVQRRHIAAGRNSGKLVCPFPATVRP